MPRIAFEWSRNHLDLCSRAGGETTRFLPFDLGSREETLHLLVCSRGGSFFPLSSLSWSFTHSADVPCPPPSRWQALCQEVGGGAGESSCAVGGEGQRRLTLLCSFSADHHLLPPAWPLSPFHFSFCPYFHFLLIYLLKNRVIKFSGLNPTTDF